MKLSDAISKRLLQLCEENNITVNKLATRAGVTHSTIHDLISCKSNNVKIKTLYKIAMGLNMSVSELLDFKEMNEEIFEDDD